MLFSGTARRPLFSVIQSRSVFMFMCMVFCRFLLLQTAAGAGQLAAAWRVAYLHVAYCGSEGVCNIFPIA